MLAFTSILLETPNLLSESAQPEFLLKSYFCFVSNLPLCSVQDSDDEDPY